MHLSDIWLLTEIALVLVGMCAVFATVATVVTLVARLPGWAGRRLWRRFAR